MQEPMTFDFVPSESCIMIWPALDDLMLYGNIFFNILFLLKKHK